MTFLSTIGFMCNPGLTVILLTLLHPFWMSECAREFSPNILFSSLAVCLHHWAEQWWAASLQKCPVSRTPHCLTNCHWWQWSDLHTKPIGLTNLKFDSCVSKCCTLLPLHRQWKTNWWKYELLVTTSLAFNKNVSLFWVKDF